MTKDIAYIYIYNLVISDRKIMSFTQNDWVQRSILNKIILLTNLVKDTKHDVIPIKYQKYSSTTILKHENILAKVDKLSYVFVLNMIPHGAFIIPIHLRKFSISEISHKQME